MKDSFHFHMQLVGKGQLLRHVGQQLGHASRGGPRQEVKHGGDQ
jgi:hypothetical protein